MPTFKRRVPPRPDAEEKPRITAAVKSKVSLVLPNEDTEPIVDLQAQITLLYGEPGIGKSSILSEFPGTLFCMFDPGVKNLRLRKIPKDKPAFAKWSEFEAWVPTILKSDYYQNIIFDTSDMAHRLATIHVCEHNGWDHVSEAGYAKGYDRADEEFIKQVSRLTSSGKGVLFTSHMKSKKYERANGTTYDRLMPSLQDRPLQLVVGLCDIVAYYGYTGEERRLWIGGNDFILTKCRPEHNFLTTGGERLISIPMGDSHEEAYENLMAAWNNELDDVGGISKSVNPTRRLRKAPIVK